MSPIVAVALAWLVVAGSLALLLGAVTRLRGSRCEGSPVPGAVPGAAPGGPAPLVPAPRTATSPQAQGAAAPR